jgi:beta-lactamase regulating signal transducer with metallopeptidase domain
MDALNHLADTLLTRLLWTSMQAALLIGAVYLTGRLWPRLSAAMRCMLWWLVGAQLLLGLAWHAPLQLPLLAPTALQAPAAAAPATGFFSAVAADAVPAPVALPATPPLSWRTGIAAVWLVLVLLQVLLACRQWRRSRYVLRVSRPVRDPALLALRTRQAQRLGLRHCPQLRTADAITSPQVTGLWRPVVLLPAGHALSIDEAAMALAHELAHVRRGDLWLAWVPALAQCLFCFHPLVRWAMREYALNRESACDAQVVQHAAAPQDYGRLLLRLGVAQPMHAGLAGASPTFHNLKRRLTMLQQTVNQPSARMRGWLLVALIALIGVLPYRVTAAGADKPTAAPTPPPTHMPAPPTPPPAPPAMPLPAVPAAPATPPASPLPPSPPQPANALRARHASVAIHSDADDGFALLDGDTVIVNGSNADLAAARLLQRDGKATVWFRRGDKAYLIDDPAYVRRARAAYAPVDALGRQQGELGGRQGELGGRQGALGAQQGALGARQGELAGQRALLAGQRAMLAAQSSQHTSASSAAEDAREQALDRQQEALSQQQEALGRQQAELGKQQAALGAQQAALGQRQQQASDQANRQIRQLLDEAIAKGVAKPTSR